MPLEDLFWSIKDETFMELKEIQFSSGLDRKEEIWT
jgi:hypothetical protein